VRNTKVQLARVEEARSSDGARVANNGGHDHGSVRAREQEGRGKGGRVRASGRLSSAR
jgi:hypothetical protein